MSASTFITQKQLMTKNMPADAMDNPFAQQQKILLYVFPLIFAVSGVNFPIGVLLYWLTTNVWSMGQQFYVIRRMPAPGSPAEEALERRARRQGKAQAPGGAVRAGEPGRTTADGATGPPAPAGRPGAGNPSGKPRGSDSSRTRNRSKRQAASRLPRPRPAPRRRRPTHDEEPADDAAPTRRPRGPASDIREESTTRRHRGHSDRRHGRRPADPVDAGADGSDAVRRR